MAYDRHFRITFSGTLGPAATPVEEWSCGIALGLGPDLTIPDVTALADLATEVRPAFVSNLLNKCCQAVTLTRVRVAAIGVDGKTLRSPEGAYLHGDNLAVSTSAASGAYPAPQTALVVSLYSELEDLTGRGRFYLPMPVVGIDTDLRVDEVARDPILQSAQTFLNAVNAATFDDVRFGRVVIASQGSAARNIQPANRDVVSVGVGRVLDTMRSRRKGLEEDRAYLPVTTP